MEVRGRDGGFPVGNNGTAILLVYIEDANDNHPIFNPGWETIIVHQSIDNRVHGRGGRGRGEDGLETVVQSLTLLNTLIFYGSYR